jgi:hypothetical protein
MSPFDQHQATTAEWMGYPDAAAMNAVHDALHCALCDWLGIKSHSMADAAGEPFDPKLSAVEESAVLHVQRLMAHHGIGLPQ